MSMPTHIPLATPDLDGCEADYLARCVDDNWVSSAGPFVVEFENQLAALTNRRHAIATVNGTAAIHLALLAAGVMPGDRVILPDWTFAATANAICHAGAVPFFVDITHDNWSLDANLVAEVLDKNDHGVTAVIVVHPLGQTADMDTLRVAAKQLPLIEDAAGAIGAEYKGQPAGAFGDFAAFSFNGNKTVTAGGGGMVVCNCDARAKRIRHLSTQARVGKQYVHDTIGFNYRMTNLNAAVGLAQIERLGTMLEAKKKIATCYDAAIAGRRDLMPMPRPKWANNSCWLYSVLTATPEDGSCLIHAMAEAGIEAREFWRSLSAQAPYSEMPNLLRGVSASLTGRVISLPSSSHLDEGAQGRVIEALGSWCGSTFEFTA